MQVQPVRIFEQVDHDEKKKGTEKRASNGAASAKVASYYSPIT